MQSEAGAAQKATLPALNNRLDGIEEALEHLVIELDQEAYHLEKILQKANGIFEDTPDPMKDGNVPMAPEGSLPRAFHFAAHLDDLLTVGQDHVHRIRNLRLELEEVLVGRDKAPATLTQAPESLRAQAPGSLHNTLASGTIR